MNWYRALWRLRTLMRLRKVIKEKGIKQSWIAGELGISSSYLSLVLNKKRRLTKGLEENFNLLVTKLIGEHVEK